MLAKRDTQREAVRVRHLSPLQAVETSRGPGDMLSLLYQEGGCIGNSNAILPQHRRECTPWAAEATGPPPSLARVPAAGRLAGTPGRPPDGRHRVVTGRRRYCCEPGSGGVSRPIWIFPSTKPCGQRCGTPPPSSLVAILSGRHVSVESFPMWWLSPPRSTTLDTTPHTHPVPRSPRACARGEPHRRHPVWRITVLTLALLGPVVQCAGVSWIRLVSPESLPEVLPAQRDTRRCLPSSGSRGSRFSTFRSTIHR